MKHPTFDKREKRDGTLSLIVGLLTLVTVSTAAQPNAVSSAQGMETTASNATAPAAEIDWRHRVPSSAFQQTADGEWVSSPVEPPFPFDELIYSWHIHQPGDAFRLYLKAGFGPTDESEWLDAGFWGPLPEPPLKRTQPTFDRGVLEMDWLKLNTPATRFRFKVVANGNKAPAEPPSLTVITTRKPSVTSTTPTTQPTPVVIGGLRETRVLDIPLRRQFDSNGRRLIDRCQSAALASAMEYYGKVVPLEDIVKHTYDPEYEYPGIWPRVIGAAHEFGLDAYIERFRDWTAVRHALAENKVLLCSIRMKEGQCQAPPYRSMGNHIVALCGVTDDGRVVVTDSFLGKSGRGYLCQWLRDDFEDVWMRTKGGVAMVICPPEGASVREATNLPSFPKDRNFPVGDDH